MNDSGAESLHVLPVSNCHSVVVLGPIVRHLPFHLTDNVLQHAVLCLHGENDGLILQLFLSPLSDVVGALKVQL